MGTLETHETSGEITPLEEKGLSHFLATLPKEGAKPKPFLERTKVKTQALFVGLWDYFRSPEFFIWVRNWLQINLFYLFPASLAAPLMTYCCMGPETPRLKYLEYGTLDTLWRANLLSLAIILTLTWFHWLLLAQKVEVKKNSHPFFRIFWHWIWANFVYVLPILLYGTIKAAWYFLEGMARFETIVCYVILFWSIATFFSLWIMGVTAAVGWVFRNLGRPSEAEDDMQEQVEMPLENEGISVEDVKILEKTSDDDHANKE